VGRIQPKTRVSIVRWNLKEVGWQEVSRGVFERTEIGMPQGGPLSPLLSNIMLNELDRELTRRGHRFLSICEMETGVAVDILSFKLHLTIRNAVYKTVRQTV
jgi:retron-type reverse transcriptase